MPLTSISHTLLEDLQRCEKRFVYRHVLGFSRRVRTAKVERGDWVHALLAAYWRALREGSDPVPAIEAAHARVKAEWWDVLFEEQQEELGVDLPDVCLGIARRYAAQYLAYDRANWRRIVGVEAKGQVQLPGVPLPFTFKADVLALDQHGWLWVIEHKVVGEIPNEDNRAADTQGPRYILALRRLLKERGIKAKGVGVLYDYLRDRVPAVPRLNKDGSLSRQWIDTDYGTYLAAIQQHGLNPSDYSDILDRLQRESKPYFERWAVPKSQALLDETEQTIRELVRRRIPDGVAVRALDRHRCPWDCEFFQLCLVEMQGGDIGPVLREYYEVKEGQQ